MEKSCLDCKFLESYTSDEPCESCLNEHKLWQPKEEPKVEEKLYTVSEAFKKLEENNGRTAETINGCGHDMVLKVKANGFFELRAKDGKGADGFSGNIELSQRWKILEPEPKKVSFAEAFKAYKRKEKISSDVTGKVFQSFPLKHGLFYDSTDEEIDGEWIVLD